jgi:tellurite resistance protein
VFLECAVGAVNTRLFRIDGAREDAHVEIRWSARMGTGPVGGETPRLPSIPQRWMFVLTRAASAKTNTDHGLSTNRCPNCNAPLTDTLSASCDFCGANLDAGNGDWVLRAADPYEAWDSNQARWFAKVEQFERQDSRQRASEKVAASVAIATPDAVILDVRERERLLYMMAAIAAADGVIDGRERKLLKLCSERWSVPWSNVELALESGDQLFDRLIERGSPEAEKFLQAIVQMALIDGKVDRKERRMLESAAQHLGIPERLPPMLEQKS